MISHDQCRDWLGEYLDQTLAPSEREKVAAHLESCADCAQIARELGAIRATLRDFKPAPAPPLLRQNVRAALQNEQRARAAHPQFVWRLPQLPWPRLATRQFAWSGTLAFSALALYVLAQPFATTPESFSETGASPEGGRAVAPPGEAPVSKAPAVKPGSVQQSAPRPPQVKSAAPKSKAPSPASDRADISPASRARLETVRPAPNFSALPKPSPSSIQAPRIRRPESNLSAPKTRSAPAASVPAPIAPKNDASGRASRAQTPLGAASRAQNATSGALPASRARSTPSQPLFQNRVADSADSTRDDANPMTESESGVRFSLQLKAAPAPKAASSADAISKADASPETQREAGETSNPVAAEGPLASPSGTAARARALRPMPRSAPPASVEKISPSDGAAAFSAPNAIVSQTPAINRVRRYELQIRAPRAVSKARIRLELPSDVRLVWPASPIVWSGDLVPEKPAAIAFSLADGRGGEKISVVMEQKLADGKSRVLETQTLTLPATERP